MIYVVSGYRRSGTSAMMGALQAGGIPVVFNPDLEKMNIGTNGYKPNPVSLYEIGRIAYMEPGLLHQLLLDGHAIKIFFDGLPTLPKGDYKIIYMVRDVDEINESLRIALENVRSAGERPNSGGQKPFDVYSPYAQKEIDWVLGICDARSDIDLCMVDYHDLVNDPGRVLEELHLPINIGAAAKAIDEKHYRVKSYNERICA